MCWSERSRASREGGRRARGPHRRHYPPADRRSWTSAPGEAPRSNRTSCDRAIARWPPRRAVRGVTDRDRDDPAVPTTQHAGQACGGGRGVVDQWIDPARVTPAGCSWRPLGATPRVRRVLASGVSQGCRTVRSPHRQRSDGTRFGGFAASAGTRFGGFAASAQLHCMSARFAKLCRCCRLGRSRRGGTATTRSRSPAVRMTTTRAVARRRGSGSVPVLCALGLEGPCLRGGSSMR